MKPGEESDNEQWGNIEDPSIEYVNEMGSSSYAASVVHSPWANSVNSSFEEAKLELYSG
jgi:hypothetical protein